MSNENEITRPLLSRRSGNAMDSTLSQTDMHSPECSFAFWDDYASVSGVPSRVIRPSKRAGESDFSSHAFSADGSRIATGETNGTVRVWTTSDYSMQLEAPELFEKPVDTLSFVSGSANVLIGVDTRGNVIEFTFASKESVEGTSDGPASKGRFEILRESSTERLTEDGRRVHTSTRQFSEDGRTLACGSWEDTPLIDVYRFTDAHVEHITLEPKHCAVSFPNLSKNGNSLLACSAQHQAFREMQRRASNPMAFKVLVWPKLSFHKDPKAKLLYGDRAVWGRKGEYLLLWNSCSEHPKLTVHKTDCLWTSETARHLRPLAEKSLQAGLITWQAQMLERHQSGEHLEVLIYELDGHGRRRFLIWDVTCDIVKQEVTMVVDPKREIDMTRWKLHGKSAEEIVETQLPPQSPEAYFNTVMEDALPRFCASSNAAWIALFSWREHAGAVCSTNSSVTVWNFTVPEDVLMDPFQMWNQIAFDPTGRHLVVTGDSLILAFAPSFLNPDRGQYQVIKKSSHDMLSQWTNTEQASSEILRLPSEALAQILTGRAKMHVHGFWFMRTVEHTRFAFVRDVAFSADGLRVGILAFATLWQFVVITADAKAYQECKRNSQLYRPEIFPHGHDDFDPGRIFFYQNHDEEPALVLLSSGFKPDFVFCDLVSKTSTRVHLEMQRCNKVSQTEDRQKLVLLDVDSICFLDLTQQRITQRIVYGADLMGVINLIRRNTRWLAKRTILRDKNFDRRISDDGQVILLTWDAKHRRSIVMTPNSNHDACKDLIKASGKSLSDCCMLTSHAKCTCFLDVDDLPLGAITIGVFNEKDQTVTHRFHVQTLPVNIPETSLQALVSSIFFELSNDGTTLTSATTPTDPAASAYGLEEEVRVFSLYGAADYIPNYNRITADKHSDMPELFSRLFEKYGSSVLNAPFAEGKTVFHEAVVKRNQELIDGIVAVATRNASQLALNWTPLSDGPTNILQSELLTRSTNYIRDAVQHICSKLVPFNMAAAITKASFRTLSSEHLDILSDALYKDDLILQACILNVHVDFLNPKLRQDSAVHIITADTILEWLHVTDPNVLEKNWRWQNLDTVRGMERDGNVSTMLAVLKIICIEDAAKVGMKGIIRPLLLQQAPPHIFKCDVVKWVILYKWFRIWKSRFIWSAVRYFSFLASFTLYAVLVGNSVDISAESDWRKIFMTAVQLVIFVFGVLMLTEEISQIRTFVRDGMDYFGQQIWGFNYFLRSRWNWLDMVSCILLTVFIPVFHYLALFDVGYDQILSAVIAVESILAFIKMWYFAQPFRGTGALVLMIDNIIQDCVSFLGLAFVILFGFGLALHILFRHALAGDEVVDGLSDAYGTLQSSLATLFYALLGTFEPEIYHSAGHLSWLTTATFSVYMIAQSIVLLNLLIAIMGDTFDRVKSTEDAQLLMGRAMFIDACEAAMTEREKDETEKRIGKYVLALVNVKDEPEIDATVQWMGKLKMLEESFRASFKKSEQSVRELMREQERQAKESTQKMLEQVTKATTQQDIRISEIANKVDALAVVAQQHTAQLELFHSRLSEMNESNASQLERVLSLLQQQTDT